MRPNDCLSSEWIKRISLDDMHSYRKYKTWSEVSFRTPNISSLLSFTWPYNINNAHDIFLCVDDLKATRVIAVTTYKWTLFVSSHKHLFTFVVTDEYIYSCTWSFCWKIHHILLWQVLILRWCLPYLYFAFICYFRLINPVVVSPTVAAVRLSFFSYIWFC